MCFKSIYDAQNINPAYKNLKIPNFRDILTLNNCQFSHDQINEKIPVNFNGHFKRTRSKHNWNARGIKEGTAIKLAGETTAYGLTLVNDGAWSD